jgi:hypothetical protein
MASHYAAAVAAAANTATGEQQNALKALVGRLVGYLCKIACVKGEDSVDIYVFSEEKKAVTDWLEMQPTGAVGVIFESYSDPDADVVTAVSDRCDAYNEEIGVDFESDEESESGSEGEGSEGGESEGDEKE